MTQIQSKRRFPHQKEFKFIIIRNFHIICVRCLSGLFIFETIIYWTQLNYIQTGVFHLLICMFSIIRIYRNFLTGTVFGTIIAIKCHFTLASNNNILYRFRIHVGNVSISISTSSTLDGESFQSSSTQQNSLCWVLMVVLPMISLEITMRSSPLISMTRVSPSSRLTLMTSFWTIGLCFTIHTFVLT